MADDLVLRHPRPVRRDEPKWEPLWEEFKDIPKVKSPRIVVHDDLAETENYAFNAIYWAAKAHHLNRSGAPKERREANANAEAWRRSWQEEEG